MLPSLHRIADLVFGDALQPAHRELKSLHAVAPAGPNDKASRAAFEDHSFCDQQTQLSRMSIVVKSVENKDKVSIFEISHLPFQENFPSSLIFW